MDPTQAIAWHDDNDNLNDDKANDEEIQILVSLIVKDKEKVFELPEGTHSIGRTIDNKIVLSYASISKKHALLEVSKSSNTVYCFVTDCGSLNKTRLCRSDDEKGIVLAPNTRYEILPGSKLIFGDVACQLVHHTTAKETVVPHANAAPEEVKPQSDAQEKTASPVFKKPASLEATQAYEVTDEELLNELLHESHDVVPKRRASKWGADHATQPYEESDTTLGSLNNTAGNASLKSDSSTLWFKKDKPAEEMANTQAYDEDQEATQGPDRLEIKVIVTAPTQAYDDSVGEDKHKDEAATQAYDEISSDAKPKDGNATQAYDVDVPMKDVNATLAYEEPSSPVKPLDNATQAYDELLNTNVSNNNATQLYDEPTSPKAPDNNATQAYEEPLSPVKVVDNNATQAYEEPLSPQKLDNATLAYEDNDEIEEEKNNATQAYDDDKPAEINNATQAYDEPCIPMDDSNTKVIPIHEDIIRPEDNENATQAYEEPKKSEFVSPTKSNKVVKFAEATQVYEEPSSPKPEDINNTTLPIAEPNSPIIDNNATLPIVEFDSPEPTEKQRDEKMEIDNLGVSDKQEDEEPSNLFHDSNNLNQPLQPQTRVNPETRHSDSSDTQGPPQSKVTVTSSSTITTSIVDTTVDNEATLMIVDSAEIKNNESMEATLQLPSTPPAHVSPDSQSDEGVESMPSDLWFIKHKDKAAEDTEPNTTSHPTGATTEQNNDPSLLQPETSASANENQSAVSNSLPQEDASLNNNTELQPRLKSRRTTLRKSLSPTRVRAKIEPDEGVQEEGPPEKVPPPPIQKTLSAIESQQLPEAKSTRGRRKSKSDASESQPEHAEIQTPTKRTTRRTSNTNVSTAEVKEEHVPSPEGSQDHAPRKASKHTNRRTSTTAIVEASEEHVPSPEESQDHTPRKASKRKLSQSVDDSPRAPKRAKTSPEAKSSQSKAAPRRKSTSDAMETDARASHILFTGFPEDTLKKYTKTVETLGGHVVTDLKHVSDCTHLVTDSAQRTVKFLAALNCVKHIVTSKWIEKCQKQHAFVEESSFVLRDHAAERKFDFHLEHSLQRAAERKVFAGVSFVITAKVKPAREDLITIVTTAGGQYVKTAPKKVDPALVVIACADDLALARTLHEQRYRVYTPEFVLSSVIRQEIDYAQNLLPNMSAPEPDRKKSKKK